MMKTFTKNLKNLCIALLLIGATQTLHAQCTANFTFTYNTNGNVSFTGIANPSISAGYFWSFGNNQTANGKNTNMTYTANGTYTVCLSIWTPSAAPTCSASVCQTINVTNAITPTCVLSVNYSTTTIAANTKSFTSTSSGTIAGSTYMWYYGDATSGSGNPSTHVYPGSGNYNCKLVVDNNNGCKDSITKNINVPATCSLSASFNATQMGNGNVNFQSTSTGTTAGTTYTWKSNNVTFATGNPASNQFVNGTYTITLTANNNFTPIPCVSTSTQVITVTSNTCAMSASFSAVQGASGQFTFTNMSSGTNASTTYHWDFGDAFNTNGVGPHIHTYANAGIHYASLFIQDSNNMSCYDSVVVPVNVTSVPCVANSNFTLTQISPGFWNATPAYPWNVVAATWSWGDATFSNSLYANHTYSPTGLYNICLTVSVSCGATSSTCATYSITKSSEALTMAYINVVPPPSITITRLKQVLITEHNVFVYPNPSNGEFDVNLIGINETEARIKVYNVTGTLVYDAKGNIENGNLNHHIAMKKIPGVYFVKVESGSNVITKKIILKD